MVSTVTALLSVIPIVQFVVLTGLAVLVLSARAKSPGNQAFAILAGLLGLQGIFDALSTILGEGGQAPGATATLLRLFAWVTLAAPAFFIHFSFVFPSRSRPFDRRHGALLSALTATVVSLAFIALYEWQSAATGGRINCLYETIVGGRTACIASPLGLWGQAYAFAASVFALYLLIEKYRRAEDEKQRVQGRLLVTGFTMMVVSILLAPAIPVLGVLYAIIATVTISLLTVLFGAFVAYSVLKYQTFRFEVFFRKAVSYVFTGIFLAVAWVALGELLEGFVGQRLETAIRYDVPDRAMSVMSAIVVFLFIGPIENNAAKIVSKVFPKAAWIKEEARISMQAMRIYRNALKEAWHDGEVHGRERQVLASLRSTLGISDELHKEVKGEVLEEIVREKGARDRAAQEAAEPGDAEPPGTADDAVDRA